MSAPLDDQYLEWLYSQVASAKQRNSSRGYWVLMRQLYAKQFVWLVPNDGNRAEDGRDLRYEFFEEAGIEIDDQVSEWANLGCSVLEMLVGLSRRLGFEAEGDSADWFWHLIENLELADCTDRSNFDWEAVDDVLDRLVWRQYHHDGKGGLFPLKDANEDQRRVELWYQLNAYVLERY